MHCSLLLCLLQKNQLLISKSSATEYFLFFSHNNYNYSAFNSGLEMDHFVLLRTELQKEKLNHC